jgi:hypothetical protein
MQSLSARATLAVAQPPQANGSTFLVHSFVVPKPLDLVLHQQLTPFQFRNSQIVDRRMGKRRAEFLLKRLMPLFQFHKVRSN